MTRFKSVKSNVGDDDDDDGIDNDDDYFYYYMIIMIIIIIINVIIFIIIIIIFIIIISNSFKPCRFYKDRPPFLSVFSLCPPRVWMHTSQRRRIDLTAVEDVYGLLPTRSEES